jgi:ACR3 family arsenite efflux pump ArsB
MIWKILDSLKRHILIVIPFVTLIGLIAGNYTDLSALQSLILPLTLLIIFPIMIGLDLGKLMSTDDLKPQTLAVILNFVLIPIIGVVLIFLFLKDNLEMSLGLFLIAVLPTSGGMTITWTGIAKGNVNLAIKLTIMGLLLGIILAPFYINFIFQESFSISLFVALEQIFFVLLVPLILGAIIRAYLRNKLGQGHFNATLKPKLSIVSHLFLYCLVFVSISLKASKLLSKPLLVLEIGIPLLLFYLTTFISGTICGKVFLRQENAIALIYGTAMRSLSIVLVISSLILKDYLGEIALLVSLAFIAQILLASVYLRFTDFLFKNENARNN